MNDLQDTAVTEVAVAEAPVYLFNEATGRFEDSEGNPQEVFVTDEGEVASASDVTVH